MSLPLVPVLGPSASLALLPALSCVALHCVASQAVHAVELAGGAIRGLMPWLAAL